MYVCMCVSLSLSLIVLFFLQSVWPRMSVSENLKTRALAKTKTSWAHWPFSMLLVQTPAVDEKLEYG